MLNVMLQLMPAMLGMENCEAFSPFLFAFQSGRSLSHEMTHLLSPSDAMDVIQKIGAFADSKNKKKYSKTLQTLRRNAAKHEESVKAESGKLMKALKDKYTELKAFDDDVNETMMGDLKDILDYFERLRNDLRAYKEAVSKAAQYTSEASSTSHAEITALVSEGERQVAVLQAGFQASQTGIDSELE
ncbi:hypothetical protein K437DRAFT_80727 [Tilletiaria anomala UBC 951]|uniref:Uncharacterized protein n=1 Tax=Tilletiaria anomala (strain ATCC 24038 / CBS 436.72 / UBC 951) TaxID=1037660 RepID=A0A066V173_TILAU|nr:uncharacterized protein K437DRAFT_80727 [Tilletiaria anomala UBC 951]KDN35216.1 hypothetical protein K437DRAFT_80727 [Tilletiaria anomala UBC 951]